MALREEMCKTGSWFFRWRSYLPLIIFGVMFMAITDFHYPYNNHTLDEVWEVLCLVISFSGLLIRIKTVGHTPENTSGRNTKEQIANRLNTTGMYSIVRNPLYLGNFLIFMGVASFLRLWWFSLVVLLMFILYYERIILAEEEYLRKKFGEIFLKWAEETPCFFPKFNKWTSPDLPFSLKNALKREYSGFFGIIASFTFLEIVGDLIIKKKFELDLMWVILFSGGLFIYLILRTIKRKTKLLNVEGR